MTQLIKGDRFTSPSPLMGEGWGEGVLKNAKQLRTNMTDAEKKIWRLLRAKRFANYKFRRQVPVGNYIADFMCYRPKLVIELDGGQHSEQQDYDRRRDQFFINQGFQVLRFWNDEALKNTDGVAGVILKALTPLPNPLPNPLPQGERGLEGAL